MKAHTLNRRGRGLRAGGRGLLRGWGSFMEELLKKELCLKSLKPLGGLASGGFINKGQSYQTETGPKIFVKSNDKEHVSVYKHTQ